MVIVDVDVVGVQPPQTLVQGMHQMLAAGSLIVGPVAHFLNALGRQHDVVAAVGDGLAGDNFRLAASVHVGGIDEVDAQFVRLVNDSNRVCFAGLPAEHHGSETDG